jgi:hypothetical protein
MKAEDKITFTVNDLDKLQKEFYRMYNPDYWLYRIKLLKNSHDSFVDVKTFLNKDIHESESEDYKRMIRTELHFLYFQMIETLFEIIFALENADNRDLWAALTFSNDKTTYFYSNTYKKISDLSDTSDIFREKMNISILGEEVEVPVLRWLFYFVYPTSLSEEKWTENLKNIKRLLVTFSKDFSDRGEYNAYKHSLRFYNAPFEMMIGLGRNNVQHLGSADDSITFLEARKARNTNGDMVRTGQIARVQKPFDFQRDYTMCILIYTMIKNIIYTRKYSLLSDLEGEHFDIANFVDVDFSKTVPRTIITKTSFAV